MPHLRHFKKIGVTLQLTIHKSVDPNIRSAYDPNFGLSYFLTGKDRV